MSKYRYEAGAKVAVRDLEPGMVVYRPSQGRSDRVVSIKPDGEYERWLRFAQSPQDSSIRNGYLYELTEPFGELPEIEDFESIEDVRVAKLVLESPGDITIPANKAPHLLSLLAGVRTHLEWLKSIDRDCGNENSAGVHARLAEEAGIWFRDLAWRRFDKETPA